MNAEYSTVWQFSSAISSDLCMRIKVRTKSTQFWKENKAEKAKMLVFCCLNRTIPIYSRLSRCCIARGSSWGFFWCSPTKVEAHRHFILEVIMKIDWDSFSQYFKFGVAWWYLALKCCQMIWLFLYQCSSHNFIPIHKIPDKYTFLNLTVSCSRSPH